MTLLHPHTAGPPTCVITESCPLPGSDSSVIPSLVTSAGTKSTTGNVELSSPGDGPSTSSGLPSYTSSAVSTSSVSGSIDPVPSSVSGSIDPVPSSVSGSIDPVPSSSSSPSKPTSVAILTSLSSPSPNGSAAISSTSPPPLIPNGATSVLPGSASSSPLPNGIVSVLPGPASTASTAVSANHHSNHAGAIAGGIIGGLIFLGLIILALFYRRALLKRLYRNRTAPSAEFINHPEFIHTRQNTNNTLLRGVSPYVDEEQPPPFTPGSFNDPIVEKVTATAAAQREMFDPFMDYEDRGASAAAGSRR
ncbi:hypothetical protein PHLCEN_2v13012 [Hermanssonia centrifuga]|uniref:Uncharacterized protein n=1 Tax=Hermanssonia centrifuga TaxID=98765 RepID=A0A2R6NFP2_9APHY|nr:hypothetical protein PHLCEN_2v13012 [Hermanssonia centrifuga]